MRQKDLQDPFSNTQPAISSYETLFYYGTYVHYWNNLYLGLFDKCISRASIVSDGRGRHSELILSSLHADKKRGSTNGHSGDVKLS